MLSRGRAWLKALSLSSAVASRSDLLACAPSPHADARTRLEGRHVHHRHDRHGHRPAAVRRLVAAEQAQGLKEWDEENPLLFLRRRRRQARERAREKAWRRPPSFVLLYFFDVRARARVQPDAPVCCSSSSSSSIAKSSC